MEETIGYEALFSPEEWDAIQTGDYTTILEEAELEFGSVSPQGEKAEPSHEVMIYDPPGQYAGNEDKFEIECELCGTVGTAASEDEANAIARLHTSFVATLVEKFEVTR